MLRLRAEPQGETVVSLTHLRQNTSAVDIRAGLPLIIEMLPDDLSELNSHHSCISPR